MSIPDRFFRTPIVGLAAMALLLMVAACDSGGGAEEESFANEFSFSISEVTPSTAPLAAQQASTTLDGFSFFFEGTEPESNEDLFLIYFTQNNDLSDESASQGLFGFVVRYGPRPGVGDGNFVSLDTVVEPTEDFGMMLLEGVGDFGTAGGSFQWYLSDGGTIDVTTSSEDRVEGTINAEAMRVSFDGSASDTTRVTIDGSFAAQSANSFVGFSPFTP
jgi:hypothetical protein